MEEHLKPKQRHRIPLLTDLMGLSIDPFDINRGKSSLAGNIRNHTEPLLTALQSSTNFLRSFGKLNLLPDFAQYFHRSAYVNALSCKR